MKRSGRRDDTEELSAGRVEYLEQARQRARTKRLRRTGLLVALLAIIVIWATGAVGTSIAAAKDLVDSVWIFLKPEQGYPQQTGLEDVYQVETLSGSYVVLGKDGCVVYANSGGRLSSTQAGYGRPVLAAGKNRFVLYNRAGKELRVESRLQTLYTKTMDNNIYLCAVSDNGKLAVVTDDTRYLATMTVYSATMEQQLSWSTTMAEGLPFRLAFSPDGRRLAIAALTAQNGQTITNIYLLELNRGEPTLVASETGCIPQAMEWTGASRFITVFDDHISQYTTGAEEAARVDFGGEELAGVCLKNNGAALLFGSGQTSRALILDASLAVQYEGSVPSANDIVRDNSCFYLLCDSSIEAFSLAGEYQWSVALDAKPQAMLAGDELLVFTQNMVRRIEPPEQTTEENAQG